MALDEGLDQFAALFQPLECAMLVRAHEAAVPHHIGAKNRRKLTFDGVNQEIETRSLLPLL